MIALLNGPFICEIYMGVFHLPHVKIDLPTQGQNNSICSLDKSHTYFYYNILTVEITIVLNTLRNRIKLLTIELHYRLSIWLNHL